MSFDGMGQRPSRMVGPYRLEDEIGRGGMGVVYRATKLDTGQTVALKLMLPEIAANEEFRARFVREASLGSDLDHPSIVPIYDAGEVDGELFLAMRLVEGRDLKQLLKEEGPLEPRRLLAVMRQVASALDAAHESGVVHHDIKPQNILVSEAEETSDQVYVTDFGLVKPVGSESTNSRTGAHVFGSIQYMSPEQVEGMGADGRADVYALGCVLYECLTGEIPFDRPNEVAVLWAHVHENPARVTDRRPELPGGLDAVTATAMAKHPDDRFLTCGELVEKLEEGLDRKHRPVLMPVLRPLVRRIPRPKTEREVWAPNFFPELSRVRKLTDRTNWLQVGAVTAVLMLLAIGLVEFSYKGGVVQAVTDAGDAVEETVSDLTQVVTGGEETSPSPSAKSRRKAPGRERRVAGFDATTFPSSSDEARDPRLVAQAAPAKIASQPEGTGTTPPQEEPKLVFGDRVTRFAGELFVARASGGQVTRLTTTPELEAWPEWSPDGDAIAYTKGQYYDGGSIWIMEADGSGARDLGICPRSDCFGIEWSPDGKKIAFVRAGSGPDPSQSVFVATISTRKVVRVPGLYGTGPSWSPDGNRLVDACPGHDSAGWSVCVASLDTGRVDPLVRVGTPGRRFGTFAWSPKGDRIAFEHQARIWTVRVDGSDLKQVSQSPGVDTIYTFDCFPTWTSDGEVIAYIPEGPADVVAMEPDGSNPRRVMTTPELQERWPDWWGPSS